MNQWYFHWNWKIHSIFKVIHMIRLNNSIHFNILTEGQPLVKASSNWLSSWEQVLCESIKLAILKSSFSQRLRKRIEYTVRVKGKENIYILNIHCFCHTIKVIFWLNLNKIVDSFCYNRIIWLIEEIHEIFFWFSSKHTFNERFIRLIKCSLFVFHDKLRANR